MKMMSNTNMTSTMGVTLISLMTPRRRRCRRPEATALIPLVAPIPMVQVPVIRPGRSAPLVDLARQNGRKFVREPLQALGLLVHFGRELIVENRRRYGGHKTDRGREQGL